MTYSFNICPSNTAQQVVGSKNNLTITQKYLKWKIYCLNPQGIFSSTWFDLVTDWLCILLEEYQRLSFSRPKFFLLVVCEEAGLCRDTSV